jgi:hypothetical protein
MRKLGLLVGSVVIMAAGIAPSSATPPNNTAYVEPTTGTDSGTCGAATAPCATLNQALQNITASGNVFVLSGGSFGPNYLTSAVAIHGPPDDSLNIVWSAVPPGCVGAAPGTCGLSTANYAVEIEAGPTDVLKFRDMIINNGAGTSGAMKVGTAFNVKMSDVTLRGGSGTIAQLMTVTPNIGSSQFQLVVTGGNIGYSNSGGGILVEPQGSTSAAVDISHVTVQNLQFGLKFNAAGTSAAAGVVGSVNDSEIVNFNGSGVAVVGTGSATAHIAITRSNLLNAGGIGVQVNGANALANLYLDTIFGNAIGVNLQSGGVAKTLGNNDFGNGNDCTVTGTPTACSSVLTPQSPE